MIKRNYSSCVPLSCEICGATDRWRGKLFRHKGDVLWHQLIVHQSTPPIPAHNDAKMLTRQSLNCTSVRNSARTLVAI